MWWCEIRIGKLDNSFLVAENYNINTCCINFRISITVDEYDDETNVDIGEHLIVTECWVEPQNGKVSNEDSHFLQKLDYEQVSLSVSVIIIIIIIYIFINLIL